MASERSADAFAMVSKWGFRYLQPRISDSKKAIPVLGMLNRPNVDDDISRHEFTNTIVRMYANLAGGTPTSKDAT
jgi:hypothetical protein